MFIFNQVGDCYIYINIYKLLVKNKVYEIGGDA